jgi:hypothetical protein
MCSIQDFRESFWGEHLKLPQYDDFKKAGYFPVRIENYFKLDRAARFAMDEWLYHNAKQDYETAHLKEEGICFIFYNKSEAMFFKLTWCGSV